MSNILVIEDDPGIQDSIRLILEMDGYEVEVLSTGIPIVNNTFQLPDLFILDRQLSGADGLDLCRLLKSRPLAASIPVVVLSANRAVGTLAREAGAEFFLEK